MEIFKLFGSIFVDSKEAEKSISKTDSLAQKLGKGLGTGIKTAAKWGAALGGAAIAGGAALFGMANKAAGATDRIDKLSQKIGMSRQGFQEWDFITSQSGMSIEQLQMGFKTLVNQVDGVTKGNKKSTETFKALGVSVYDANGAVKDQETVFNEAVVALQNMEEGTEKAKLANDLFGRSGAELMPLLNGAAGSVEEMKQQAHDLGLVLDDETIDAGVVFTDTLDQTKRALGSVVTQIGVHVMPIFQQMLEWVIAHMPEIKAVMKVVFDAIGKYVNIFIDIVKTYFMPILQAAVGWIKDNWPEIQRIIKVVIDTVINIIKGFVDLFKAIWDRWGDSIMAYAKYIFDTIKTIIQVAIGVIQGIIKTVTSLIKGDWQGVWDGIKQIFTSVWDGIKSYLSGAVQAVRTIISNVFGKLGDIMLKPFDWAWGKITGILDKIKNAFSKLFPVKIPMPKFSIEGSLNPLNWIKGGGLPKIKVKWNAQGALLDGATLFGNVGNTLLGGGEAGKEGIVPLEGRHMYPLADAIAERLGGQGTQIIFQGNYTFMEDSQIDYFMQKAAALVQRRGG